MSKKEKKDGKPTVKNSSNHKLPEMSFDELLKRVVRVPKPKKKKKD